jgi:acetolactate synthase-like protein
MGMNGGEIIAKVVARHGVKFIFTLVGGHISPILTAAGRHGMRVIDTRHEANAVFAADAVSRLTGVPGVAAVTAGPGITNSITAVRNALLAQSPLILLGGSAPTILKGRGALQDIDQMSLMKPNVKWAVSIKNIRQIVPTLLKAFAVAQEGVPGPVFVECPIDLLYDESLIREWYGKGSSKKSGGLSARALEWYVNRHLNRLFAGKDSISTEIIPLPINIGQKPSSKANDVWKQLASASKPVILVGSGAMAQPLRAGLLAVALQKLNIPVYLSGMARGLLGKDHPLQLRHFRKEALREADLIILAGVPCDFRLDYGRHLNKKAFTVGIHRSKKDLTQNRTPSLALCCDPCDFLIELAAVPAPEKSWKPWHESLLLRDGEREIAITQQADQDAGGINPIRLFRTLDAALNENAILVADGGDFVATASYTLRPRKPLSWLDPGVFGTLGVGAGFALGAKLCFPDSEVIILYGDGSAGYSLMEYDTFMRHHVPVISIIGNDAGWSQIARDQIEILKDDTATRLAYSDYETIGKAFGAQGKRVESITDFSSAFEEARAAAQKGIPYIINAIIGKTEFRKGSISM